MRNRFKMFRFRLLVLATVMIGWCFQGGPSTAVGQEDVAGNPDSSGVLLIQAGVVHIGDGTTLSPGMVLVVNGKIEAVAESISQPAETKILKIA